MNQNNNNKTSVNSCSERRKDTALLLGPTGKNEPKQQQQNVCKLLFGEKERHSALLLGPTGKNEPKQQQQNWLRGYGLTLNPRIKLKQQQQNVGKLGLTL